MLAVDSLAGISRANLIAALAKGSAGRPELTALTRWEGAVDEMPEALLMEIAAALAGKAAGALSDFVRDTFKRRKRALALLEAADGATPESPRVLALARALQAAGNDDPSFAAQLRAQWIAIRAGATAAHAEAAINSASGAVFGSIHAHEIHITITLQSP
jgi:hypothetical protein